MSVEHMKGNLGFSKLQFNSYKGMAHSAEQQEIADLGAWLKTTKHLLDSFGPNLFRGALVGWVLVSIQSIAHGFVSIGIANGCLSYHVNDLEGRWYRSIFLAMESYKCKS
ncbi:hypothetical protein AG1IA_10379 [Rhizoctonia solani AG-1 IA]|uniref:Uncharacterized protein n=1 Tax=Thanatephorus cucumeris (strain AG1-IA) TaxID=983506 RepID=L8WBN4_THACA|nr:hypothetical protein AG1IA_10379 [Rhizoctonia solani AG-1 IA]